MIPGQGQAPAGNREPACYQIMLIMVSILMTIIKLMTITVMTVPLATCCELRRATDTEAPDPQAPHCPGRLSNKCRAK